MMRKIRTPQNLRIAWNSLYRQGRDLPQALLMMVPEAWSKEAGLPEELVAFHEYNASFMAPWDGPAALCFTDGELVGAALDRNGLRPLPLFNYEGMA